MPKRRSLDGIAADDSADAQIFRAAVRDVTPLAQTPPAAGLEKRKPRARKAAAAAAPDDLDEAMPLIEIDVGFSVTIEIPVGMG